jgi:hypothetical protein
MDRATKEVFNAWFDVYKKAVLKFKILKENTYNIDKSRFLIRTIELTCIIFNLTLCTKHQSYLGYQE